MITTAHGKNTVLPPPLASVGREAPGACGRRQSCGDSALQPQAAPQACALLPGIVDYMIEQSGPPSKQVLALKQVQEFLKDGDDVIIVGVFKAESDPAYQRYQDAGKEWPAGQGRVPRPGLSEVAGESAAFV